jgi:hemerythrin
MTIATQNMAETLREVEAKLKDEHKQLASALLQLEAVQETSELAGILDDLHPLLHQHFAHEEYPGGLYDSLGATTPEFRDRVRELVDDHYRILSVVRSTAERARYGAGEDRRTLLKEGQEIVGWLRRHEEKEHQLAAEARARRQSLHPLEGGLVSKSYSGTPRHC